MEQEAIVIGHEAVKNVRDVEQEGIFNPDAPEVIAKAHFSKESSENGLAFKDDRVVRKPRRPSSKSESAAEGGDAHGVRLHGTSKSVGAAAGQRRVRKPRHAGRLRAGEPKKGGAGGKGVWGKLGVELDETGICKDVHDPNYDSDVQGEYKLEHVDPVLTEEELEKVVTPILKEFLEHGNTYEVEASLGKLNIGPNGHKVMRLAILLGLDRHNPQREMISQLISDLYSYILSEHDISNGFDELLATLDDLHLDTPDAPNLLGQFIARCVADDCLPPKFIQSYKGKVDSKLVVSALEKANVLLSMNHGMAHLDNIWGAGGGNRPVKSLSNKIEELLKEYVDSEDLSEAMRCLLELEVPHFHHELVFQAVDLAIEDSSDRVMDIIVRLLRFLTDAAVVTADQFEKGMKRFYEDVDDLSIDVPAAHSLLEQLALKLYKERILSDAMLQALPSRGRKRFVSEGDGGTVKNGTQDFPSATK